MKHVEVTTDGSCLGNPGPGGWAAILRYGSREKELSGGAKETTNNRMELSAVIEALSALKEGCRVTLVTDSQYVKQGIETWIKGWKQRGWKTADKKPVKNQDLWELLDEQVSRHTIDWKWTKGHAGHEGNNRCDELARAVAEEFRRGLR